MIKPSKIFFCLPIQPWNFYHEPRIHWKSRLDNVGLVLPWSTWLHVGLATKPYTGATPSDFSLDLVIFDSPSDLVVFHCHLAEMITNRFAGWISGRIVNLQPNTDIQKLFSNGNWIRISETLLSIFRGFRLLEKVAHCTIIHLLFSEASFQPSVPWLRVSLWCNLCTVV